MEFAENLSTAAPAFQIVAEAPCDVAAREALLDRAMGPGRRRKSSEKLRRGREPAQGLAFVARDAMGTLVGTVRLWDVGFERDFSPFGGEMAGKAPRIWSAAFEGASAREEGRALLLGPLAVEPGWKNAGIGSALMRHAVAQARRLGHGAILLVGDAPYYARFGFSAESTGQLSMPGPYERQRFLALELAEGALDGARGTLMATGRRTRSAKFRQAA